MKICTICKTEKLENEFHKCLSNKSGMRSECKSCAKELRVTYNATNKEKIAAGRAKKYAENPDLYRCRSKEWRLENKEKAHAMTAEWRKNNPEKYKASYKASVAKWVSANPEKARAISRASVAKWASENRGKKNAATAKYHFANPEVKRIQNQNRRAMKSAAGGKLSPGIAAKLFKLQRGKCACGCGQPLGDDYHRDHIMPIALGGSNTDDNIQLMTATCNLQKNAKHPVDFMQQRGFLL